MSARFPTGLIVATRGVAEAIQGCQLSNEQATELLRRHLTGDWGDLCDEDKRANEEALLHGDRILSKYVVNGLSLYVITEADRSLTTVLLCEEY